MIKEVKSESIEIKTADGVCDAFVAYPSAEGSYPGVLLYMDAFGLRPYLFEMAETLASHDYYVLAPNIFYREGRAPLFNLKFPLRQEDMDEVVKKVIPLARSFDIKGGIRDAKAYLDYLEAQPSVANGPIGITGYCMGGSLALRTAAAYPNRIGAVASFHAGSLATENPQSPHHLLTHINAELYIGHADRDRSMPPEQIKEFERALAESGVKYETELYEDALHGFTMADLPVGNQDAIKKHWKKLTDLFDRTLT